MLARLACLFVGYLCGSMLFAEGVARHVAGRSIFEIGDGNPGMANVGHELGTRAALICLAGDILKTLLPVLAMRLLLPGLGWGVSTAWTGLGATLGHIYPFWHRFVGGKGVATMAATIVLMNPLWGLLTAVVGVASIIAGGYLSLAAVIAIVFYTLSALVLLPLDCAVVSLIFTLLTLSAHWTKLRGIKDGTTHRASLSTRFWDKVRSTRP